MGNTGRFMVKLLQTNMQNVIAMRAAFVLQCVFMIINNLVFFVMWWIFFSNLNEVNGWRLAELEAMYGIVAAAFGVAVVFAGGLYRIARRIVDGQIDTLLCQPKSVLIQLLCSDSMASGWGDILSGIFLLVLSGYAWERPFTLLVLILSGAVIFCSDRHSAAGVRCRLCCACSRAVLSRPAAL